MPRRRRMKIGAYETSLQNFTLGTAIIWIFLTILFLILSIVPKFHVFGVVVSIAIMLSSGSLLIAINTRQQLYTVPFITVLLLIIAYILANVVIILAIEGGRELQSNNILDVIMQHISNIELLKQYVISTTALGIVLITFISYYILRGIVLYYLALKKHDDELEIDSFSSQLSVRFV